MRIGPALFLPTSALGQAAPATAGEGFAELLGLDQPVSGGLAEAPADAATPGKPPSGPGRDADTRPAHAFAFGALGLFAPDGGPAGSVGGAGSPPAVVASIEPLTPGAGPESPAARSADAVRAAGAPPTPRDAAAEAAVRFAASKWRVATGLAAVRPPPLPTASLAADAAAGVAGSAPRVRPAPAGRLTQARLTLVDKDGKLAVVAAAAHFDPADYGRLRARLAETAADLGASLEDFQINGQAGLTPAIGGPRHGHRAR